MLALAGSLVQLMSQVLVYALFALTFLAALTHDLRLRRRRLGGWAAVARRAWQVQRVPMVIPGFKDDEDDEDDEDGSGDGEAAAAAVADVEEDSSHCSSQDSSRYSSASPPRRCQHGRNGWSSNSGCLQRKNAPLGSQAATGSTQETQKGTLEPESDLAAHDGSDDSSSGSGEGI
ncbi:hypothetical protein, partial [Myxacorys almedinensis]|uniref:hypothetical protein n=1 Tax=Myxacorys almedinensis TaxID=2651157 RepID=UPI001EE43E35